MHRSKLRAYSITVDAGEQRGQNGNVSPIRAVLLLAQKPGSISRAF
jgi:hypothetical protein